MELTAVEVLRLRGKFEGYFGHFIVFNLQAWFPRYK